MNNILRAVKARFPEIGAVADRHQLPCSPAVVSHEQPQIVGGHNAGSSVEEINVMDNRTRSENQSAAVPIFSGIAGEPKGIGSDPNRIAGNCDHAISKTLGNTVSDINFYIIG